MVVVVVGAAGGVDGEHQVVGPQAVALGVCIAEDARLQQLVVAVGDACWRRGGRCVCVCGGGGGSTCSRSWVRSWLWRLPARRRGQDRGACQ
jgi:hypothetical protein